jgi:hypothetical protein
MTKSLNCLGLNPNQFRVVSEAEMAPDHDCGAVSRHSDGSPCDCWGECKDPDVLSDDDWRGLKDPCQDRLNPL